MRVTKPAPHSLLDLLACDVAPDLAATTSTSATGSRFALADDPWLQQNASGREKKKELLRVYVFTSVRQRHKVKHGSNSSSQSPRFSTSRLLNLLLLSFAATHFINFSAFRLFDFTTFSISRGLRFSAFQPLGLALSLGNDDRAKVFQ